MVCFDGWIIFPCMTGPRSVYPPFPGWMLGVFPSFRLLGQTPLGKYASEVLFKQHRCCVPWGQCRRVPWPSHRVSLPFPVEAPAMYFPTWQCQFSCLPAMSENSRFCEFAPAPMMACPLGHSCAEGESPCGFLRMSRRLRWLNVFSDASWRLIFLPRKGNSRLQQKRGF